MGMLWGVCGGVTRMFVECLMDLKGKNGLRQLTNKRRHNIMVIFDVVSF